MRMDICIGLGEGTLANPAGFFVCRGWTRARTLLEAGRQHLFTMPGFFPRSPVSILSVCRTLLLCGMISAAAFGKEERWLKVVEADFTMLTTLQAEDAIARAAEFSQFFAGVRQVISVDSRRLAPLTIVVFAKKQGFYAYSPVDAKGHVDEIDGFISHAGNSWAIGGVANTGFESVRTSLFFEGAGWLLGGSKVRLPQWVEVGLMNVFSTAVITRKDTTWGQPVAGYTDFLQRHGELRLEKMMCAPDAGVDFDDGDESFRLYATSWAMVHFMLFGQHGLGSNPLGEYLSQLQSGLTRQEAFVRVFGPHAATLDRALDEYVRNGSYFTARRPLAKIPVPLAMAASPAEVEAACARLAMAANRPALAQTHIGRLAALAPAGPTVDELRALLAEQQSDSPGKWAALRRAAEKGSVDSSVYFSLAEKLLADSATAPPLAAQEMCREAAGHFRRSLALNPRHQEAYEHLFAATVRAGLETTSIKEQLLQGMAYFPRSGAIAAGVAELDWREGRRIDARKRLEAVLQQSPAPDQITLGLIGGLQSQWQGEERWEQAKVAVAEQRFEEARKLLNEIIKSDVSVSFRAEAQGQLDRLVSH
jgi:tetratricopeptide (TPR) repeat protein